MTKRTKLTLLILLALLLLLLGLYLLLSPFLNKGPTGTGGEFTVPATQTTGTGQAPGQGKPTATGLAGEGGTATGTPARQLSDADKLSSLEYQARAAVERIGSGSNQNGFLGYTDLMIDSTDKFKIELVRLQADMLAAHPLKVALYGVSTRAASSQIKDGKYGDDTLKAEVQAVQTYDAGNPRQPTGTAAKRVFVTFAKQPNGTYLIDGMQWEDMAL